MNGMRLIASARASNLDVDTAVLHPVSINEAEAASARTFDPEHHSLPFCFVCGPKRPQGDGLRVFAGPIDSADSEWSGPLAAHWVPDASLVGGDGGLVGPEYVWSAPDCPTGYTALGPDGNGLGHQKSILLGRLTARTNQRPRAGEPCSIVTHKAMREGRKITADGILRDAAGVTLALARALWITADISVLVEDF